MSSPIRKHSPPAIIIPIAVFLIVGLYWLLPRHDQALSGIQGTVTYGPLCPIEPCSTKPTYDFDIIALKPDGTEVGRTMPDSGGRYTLTLPPDTYQVKPSRSFASTLGSPLTEATVMKGAFTHLDLSFDTGIR